MNPIKSKVYQSRSKENNKPESIISTVKNAKSKYQPMDFLEKEAKLLFKRDRSTKRKPKFK